MKILKSFWRKQVQTVHQPVIAEESLITIEQIHADFLSASDEIMDEVNKILSQPIDYSYFELIKKIESFGFSNSITVKEGYWKNTEIEITKMVADKILYYNQNYIQKFITHKKLIEICNKYGLVFGDTEHFIGQIPEKNMREIAAFKLKDNERTFALFFQERATGRLGPEHRPATLEEYIEYVNDKSLKRILYSHKVIKETTPKFKIAGTPDQFDLKNMKIENFEIKKNLPPDPVVLQPVNGGYLIVSLWGAESKIEDLQNPKYN